MRILAVIPARAGSKGVPNKNIRLLNNKPLIAYAIINAQKSRYITDIIVTSDSAEIEIIAKQMKVSFKKRSAALCGDEVTLDSVIFDVSKDNFCDYVVTMQPTSPTLNPETLDRAIEYVISNKLDTLISAINKPHLSWKESEGKKVPNYIERVNRQYLPANYVETGAFIISKYEVIKQNSRIGKKIDIFEISKGEAIDIDTFEDLKYAGDFMQKKSVAIYVNGNNTRGTGHVYRALELADSFYTKPDIYYDFNQTEKIIFGKTTHNLLPVNGLAELYQKLSIKQYDIFINDILSTSIDYMIGLRTVIPNAKIINFEDDGEGVYKADLVINALYQDTEIPYMKAGEKYYISSKLFMFYQPITIRPEVKDIFISFGGADPQNYSDRLLKIIKQEKYKTLNFQVVLGRAKLNVEDLLIYDTCENINVWFDISNMPEIMSQCDIGITSRGRTGYELALLGIPTIAMAQNKREEKHGFVNNENGFFYLGLNPSDHLIESTLDMYIDMLQEDRQKLQNTLLQHDLRNGRKRVMRLIENL